MSFASKWTCGPQSVPICLNLIVSSDALGAKVLEETARRVGTLDADCDSGHFRLSNDFCFMGHS